MMNTSTGLIAVIPAFNKDVCRKYCEAPLFVHSVNLAKACREIVKIIVATNIDFVADLLKSDPDIVLQRSTAEVAVRDCVRLVEKKEGEEYGLVLTLNPFFPHRTPENVMECFQRILIDGLADGIEAHGGAFSIWRREALWNITQTEEMRALPYEVPEYARISLENSENDEKVRELVENPCDHLP